MIVYLANIALTLILGVALIYVNPTPQKKRWFCGVTSFVWILLSGLRHWSIGADTAGYAETFERVGQTAWRDVFQALYRVYFQGYSSEASIENFLYKDPGYLLFQKIVHIFTHDYQVLLVIIATIFFVAMGRFIYRNSEDPCFSYILFCTLFYGFYAVTGHRQTLATALVVFIGYEFIKERKLGRFLITALCAYILHKSSLVFVPFYFLSYKKIDGKYMVAIGGFTGAVLAIGSSAILWMAQLFGFDKDKVYDAPTYTFTTLMVLVAIVVVLSYSSFKRMTLYKSIEVSATMLAAMFALFTLIDQSMMRIQQYYSLIMMLSLPSVFMTFKPKNRLLVTMLCTLVLLFLFIKTGAHYKFFWQ